MAMDEAKTVWLSTSVSIPFFYYYLYYLLYSVVDSEDKILYVLGATEETC